MTAKEFWDDFKDFEESLRLDMDFMGEEKKSRTFSYLCAQLDDYCLGLSPIASILGKNTNKKYVLTISCSGKMDLLLYVNRLVDMAPEIEHWEIKALVAGQIETDPNIMSEPFKSDDFSITPKDIRFTVYSWDPEKGIFDLLILLPLNLAEVDDDKLDNAFRAIFKELWGERFVGEKINCLFFTNNAIFEYDFLDLEILEVCLNSFE
ncbi:hypothetical protein [Aequorivita antarctica]|uniref:DUF695 domain-containing protein n=1 Tax=Aequorivita antarctica TaxID=153266 RepID=A0A5C6YW68_9FLAO|nr:hypothetical protein [Aequorivita antarctica]TXD71322.1 hypothetical protein ESU54_17195 [Aequorivita antarctica]SRX76453.1 hypothetical protein AEQU3_03453 [Aequorivita antarctica]